MNSTKSPQIGLVIVLLALLFCAAAIADDRAPDAPLDLVPVFERIGDDTVLEMLFESGHYPLVVDGIWSVMLDDLDPQVEDDLLLLLAEAYYRSGAGDETVRVNARRAYLYGLNLFPDSPNDAARLLRLGDLMAELGFYPEAAGYYGAFLEAHPDDPATAYVLRRLADSYRMDHNYEEALDVYQEAFRNTDDAELQFAIGLGTAATLHELGADDDAARIYSQIMTGPERLYELSAIDLASYAATYYAVNDHPKAKAAYDILEQEFPDSPYRATALYHMGLYRLVDGDWRGAKKRFDEVRRSYPDMAEYYLVGVRLADEYLKASEPLTDEAVALLTEAAGAEFFETSYHEALFLLARIDFENGRYASTMLRLDQLLDDVLGNPWVQPALRLIQQAFLAEVRERTAAGDFKTVIYTFDRFEDNLTNDLLPAESADLVGRAMLEKFQFERVEALFGDRFAARLHPDLARFYRAAAEVLDPDAGDDGANLAEFADATEDADLAARAHLILGDRARAAGDDSTATTHYRKASFAGVDDQWRARALVRLADLDLAAGNAKKALALYEAAAGLSPLRPEPGADATIAFGIAEADYELHKDAAAQAAFSVFLADYPDDPRRTLARVRLARCLERTGASLDDALAVVAPTGAETVDEARVLQAVAHEMTWWKKQRERTAP